MKRKMFIARKFFIALIAVAASMLLFSTCIIDGDGNLVKNGFNLYLKGTWKTGPSVPPENVITLEIDFYRIYVEGLGTYQMLSGINKDSWLKGYSEQTPGGSITEKEGNLYITNLLNEKKTISYNYKVDEGNQKWLILRGTPDLYLQLQED